HEPAPVGRIAVEATADLVVDAALRHCFQRLRDHLERALVAGSARVAEQELQDHALRKLRLGSEAAVGPVETVGVHPCDGAYDRGELLVRELRALGPESRLYVLGDL